MPSLRRSLPTALLLAGSLAALPALALAAGSTHPVITDQAGDARTVFGANQPQADLLSADIASDGTNLVITQRLAALQSPSATTSSTYQVHFSRPTGRLVSEVSAANANRPTATATLSDEPPVSSQDAFFLVGSVTTNLAAGTVTARYPLAQISGLTAGTLLSQLTSNTALTNTPLGLKDARDSASGADYVFGQ